MVGSTEMNLSEFRKVFSEEFGFISEAFSRCQWPKPVESDGEEEEEDDDNDSDNEAGNVSSDEDEKEIIATDSESQEEPTNVKNFKGTKNRAGTIQELLQKHNEIRSNDKKESRKRKHEEPKKKHKQKKKRKKAAENVASTGKSPAEGGTPKKTNSTKGETKSADGNQDPKQETVNNKPQKQTRAPIKHGADVVVNEEGSMLFSKLAFSDSVGELKPQLGGPKQPKHILGKLEKVNKLISSLEERGKKDKAQRLKENMSWSNAFYKAEGAKVKDSTAKVQKSVKQLAKRKRASERKWKKRLDEIKTKKETKDKKREQHIQKRVDQKKERKLKKLIRRGRFIPELKTKPS
nr:PREDICTED: surfeit locus protein 6 homolog [Bemisia tabaci]